MRDTDALQLTIDRGPVNQYEQTRSVGLCFEMTMPMPEQDDQLPETIEAYVHRVGLLVQRDLFRLLIEKADAESVLQSRRGKAGCGIQRRGKHRFTFKTIFGEVTVARTRISHNADGSTEIPSATAWRTPHQLAITQNLRDAVCDQMSDQSAAKSLDDLCEQAGDDDLLGRSTIIDVVHCEGQKLIAAERDRALEILETAPEADRAVFESAMAESQAEAVTDHSDDPLSCDESEGAEAEWEQTRAEWAATGFPGCEPALPAAAGDPREVDEGVVIVEPDEVKTKAQPATGRKEVWTYTAVVMAAGFSDSLAEAMSWVRNAKAVEELIGYLEKRRGYLPDYQERQRLGLWIARTRVEKFNDWAVSGRCKHQGMSWSPQGVLALAAMEAAWRNGELETWRRDRTLPERVLPGPVRNAA